MLSIIPSTLISRTPFAVLASVLLILVTSICAEAQTVKKRRVQSSSSSWSESSSSTTTSGSAEGGMFKFKPVKVTGAASTRKFNMDLIDTIGPEIVVKAPMITRGAKLVEVNKLVTITGSVEDQNKVVSLTVNAERAKIMDDGDFYITIPLDYGDNPIELEARDSRGNISTDQFIIERKMAVAPDLLKVDGTDEVRWESPGIGTSITEDEIYNVQACLRVSDTLRKVNLYNNGWLLKSFTPAELDRIGGCKYALEYRTVLKPDANRLRIEVHTASGVFEDEVSVTYRLFKGEYHALVIAVEEYDDAAIAPLSEPVNDAYKLVDVLSNTYNFRKSNITMLLNPTKADIIGILHQMRTTITSDDNLLIFFAGHGTWDEDMNQGYWLPRDAAHDNPVNWLSNSDLINYLYVIKSKHTLLVADACFSGGIFQTRGFSNTDPAIQRLYDLPSRKAITSGTLNEVPDRSVFMKYLIKRLSDNPHRYLTAEQLYASLRIAVLNNSPNVPQYGTIHNVGDEGGDFIFVKH